MGRVITVAMKCDRCGAEYHGGEIDLLESDSKRLVDGAKESLSDVPAFELKMGDVVLRYDDVCPNCNDRLANLAKDCGPVTKRGHRRSAGSKQEQPDPGQTSIDTDDGNGASEGKQAKPKPPTKPVTPKNPPKSPGDRPRG